MTGQDEGGEVSRTRRLLAGSRALMRIAYRDPEHLPERLTLVAVERLAEPSRRWAREQLSRRGGAGSDEIADELRARSAQAARVDGAIAGTPFLIALVPGYLAFLWQEAAMGLRTAALYGRDPAELRVAAELLALRGLHDSVPHAEAALAAARAEPLPQTPDRRRSWRIWIYSVHMLLIFGGFLPRRDTVGARRRARGLTILATAAGIATWVVTWVFPVTLMIAMAWSCESNTRDFGRRVRSYYDGSVDTPRDAISAAERRKDHGHDLRQALRTLALLASIAVPIAFVAYADHVRQTTGINWLGALGALVALSVVLATTVTARTR